MGGISYFVHDKKTVHFYPESIVYPFVPFNEEHKGKKNIFFITNEEYCEIIYFVEETKMAAIV